MNINSLKNSKFLKKEDCDPPVLVTISSVELQNVAQEGQEHDERYVVVFEELEKPMVLNSTNGQLIAMITGTDGDSSDDQSDRWIGKKIVLYNEPNVTYKGKLTGGIRVRAPKGKAVGKPAAGSAAELETPAAPSDPDWRIPDQRTEEENNIPY